MTSLKEKFKAILATHDFTQLAPFTHPVSWRSLSQDERELLGMLFIKQGELQLHQGNDNVLDSFELASQVAPHSTTVFYNKAMILADQGHNGIHYLKAANQALEDVIVLDPSFVNAWHSLGNVLVQMGLFQDTSEHFYQADEKFSEALRLLEENGQKASGILLWHWGTCWYQIGKQSGEAVDFFQTLEKFRMAGSSGCDEPEFHMDFGNVLVDLSILIGRKDLLGESIAHYKSYIKYFPDRCEGWFKLASVHQRYYELIRFPEHFNEADANFRQALELSPEDVAGWLNWGELTARVGKAYRDLDRIQESFRMFERAHEIEPDHPHVLLSWGDAQLAAAALLEDLDLLRDAESKILTALQYIPHRPEAWQVYGSCLVEFGRYFGSEEYYSKAVDQFKKGLSIDSSNLTLLHASALGFFALGELKDDKTLVEEASRLCKRASAGADRLQPHFFNDWGVILMKLGEMTQEKSHVELAAEKFHEALARRYEGKRGDEIEVEWFYNYGCAMDFLGDFHEDPSYYEKAVQILLHTLKFDPSYTHARYNLALAYYHLGELKFEVEYFNRAIELFQGLVQEDPEDEITWNDYGLALLNLAVLKQDDTTHIDEERNLFIQAEGKFLQAIALGNAHAFYNLACLNSLMENVTEALHYLEKAEQAQALPLVEDIIHDEWLDHLHDQPAFRYFVTRMIDKEEKK